MDVIFGVAIGLVLTIGVVAVVVSSVMELISAAMGLRAKSLTQGLARLLENELQAGDTTHLVMDHPLIKALSTGNKRPFGRDDNRGPAYIDAATFATAFLGSNISGPSLIKRFVEDGSVLDNKIENLQAGEPGDTVRRAWDHAVKNRERLIDALVADPAQGRAGLAALLGDASAVASRIQKLNSDGDPAAEVLEDAWTRANNDLESYVAKLEKQPSLLSRAVAGADDVKMGIAAISAKNPPLGKALADLWARADSDFIRFCAEIENWFDRQMARVNGWYSRKSQWIMLGVSLGIAFGLNISLITVAKVLWIDPDLRAATSVVAEQQVTATTVPETTVSDSTAIATTPSTASGAASATLSESATTTSDSTAPAASAPIGVDSLTEVGLPMGWNADAWPGWTGYLAVHLLGVILTGIAASFGAPFWFDLLNKFVNLRAGGRPPPTAAVQRAKEFAE